MSWLNKISISGLALALFVLINGCHHATRVPPLEIASFEVPENPAMPFDSLSDIYSGLTYPATVLRFYQAREYLPAWHNAPALIDSMVQFQKSVRRYGLLPQAYHTTDICFLRNRDDGGHASLRLDALLTDAFISLAMDLRYGRLESVEKQTVNDSLYMSILHRALMTGAVKEILTSREPLYPAYISLKKSLTEALDRSGSDRDLLMAGLTIDSLEAHRRVQRIEINIERWRQESAPISDRYIWINIPSYTLQVIVDDTVMMDSRVIVGKPKTPTRVFSSVIECLNVYPYWHVPRRISVEDYLPAIQKDSTFLSRNFFDVLDRKGVVVDPKTIDWTKYNRNYFPFTLRQREGAENALGLVKFVFDNPFAIYVHDTNARHLFKSSARALSQGCIRMEHPFELAKYLVSSPDDIDKYIRRKQNKILPVVTPIPIHIRYFTAECSSGALRFYEDVYGHDTALIKRLYGAPIKSDVRF